MGRLFRYKCQIVTKSLQFIRRISPVDILLLLYIKLGCRVAGDIVFIVGIGENGTDISQMIIDGFGGNLRIGPLLSYLIILTSQSFHNILILNFDTSLLNAQFSVSSDIQRDFSSIGFDVSVFDFHRVFHVDLVNLFVPQG